jgi:hypothetical protein
LVPARFRALLDAQDGIEVVDQGLHQSGVGGAIATLRLPELTARLAL